MTSILGSKASSLLVAEHQAGIYLPTTNKVYIASNYQTLDNPINVTTVDLSDCSVTEDVYPSLIIANGGRSHQDKALFCAEGSLTKSSSVKLLDPKTSKTSILIDNFLGRRFYSLNNIKLQNKAGDLWFTDCPPSKMTGFEQSPTRKFDRCDAPAASVACLAPSTIAEEMSTLTTLVAPHSSRARE
jgi:gluconolactonase